MRFGRWARFGAGAVSLALLAAACGSDSEGDEAAPTSAGGGASATTAASGGATANSFGPSKDNPKIILGPEGYKIDTSKCPSGWKDTDGVTDTEIKLAHSFVFSGNLAANGGQSHGIKALLDYVNATEGGIGGKKVTLTVKDDGYEAARVKANTDELLESVKPLAMPAMAGTPGNLAIYDKMNESCVPHLLVASGHPAFADPVNHPWTTNSYLLYNTEGSILAEYVAKTYGKGATVAVLVINNDFGLSYKAGFEKTAKELGVNVVKWELIDAAAATATNEITTLASTNADVFGLFGVGTLCTQAINALASTSWKPKGKLIVNTCTDNFLAAAGAAAADYVDAGYAKSTFDPEVAKTDADAQKVHEILRKGGIDENDVNNNKGFIYGYPLVQILKEAAKLPGGVSRTNVMLAAWSIDYEHPLFFGSGATKIKFKVNGVKDPANTEGAIMQRWTIDPATGSGRYVTFGDIIEKNGTTPPCAWDGKVCK